MVERLHITSPKGWELNKSTHCLFICWWSEHLFLCIVNHMYFKPSLYLSGPVTIRPPPCVWPSTPAGGCSALYLVNTLGVLQPGVVHFLHVVGARPIQERLWGHRCSVAPDWLKRPCATCGGDCDWPLLADSLSRLRGGERTQSRRTSP